MSLRIGIVVDNNDPDNLRRVKVQSQDRGESVSDWLSRVTGFTNEDLPVPQIGDTVVISSIDDNTHTDIVLGVLTSSTSNQPLNKKSKQDYLSVTEYSHKQINSKIDFITRFGNVCMSEDGTIKLFNTLGSITLLPNGYTVITNPSGSITFGSNGLSFTSPMPINFDTPNLTFNGSRVSVVGGTDSRGDTTLS